MPIILAASVLVLFAILLGPQWWIRHVLKVHGAERTDLPGTGGEFARHLLDEANLQSVKVEPTDAGDRYDPVARAVRLLPQHHDGRSIAAVAVAAHEVSHAVQHARGERLFARRIALVSKTLWVDRIASGLLLLAPVVFIFVKAPILVVLQLAAGLALFAVHIVVHAVTLPVEFDASFDKALPAIERGRYLGPNDLPAARRVLTAAAWTYVAAALATLLNIARWFRVLRF